MGMPRQWRWQHRQRWQWRQRQRWRQQRLQRWQQWQQWQWQWRQRQPWQWLSYVFHKIFNPCETLAGTGRDCSPGSLASRPSIVSGGPLYIPTPWDVCVAATSRPTTTSSLSRTLSARSTTLKATRLTK